MPDYAPEDQQLELAAKIRCCDKFFAGCHDGKYDVVINDWDYDFIANLKDWIDVKNRKVTLKQAKVINRIYELSQALADRTTFDFSHTYYATGA